MNLPSKTPLRAARLLITLLALSGYAAPGLSDSVVPLIDAQVENDQRSIASQKKINQYADETSEMVREYQQLLQQLSVQKRYNQQLDTLVADQHKELTSIEQQLTTLADTSRQLMPQLITMVDTLTQFVALDTPFLSEQRTARNQRLKLMMGSASTSLAEKFRRIIDSYQQEMEYGRTLEAYQGELNDGTTTRTVNFLRVGRLLLLYQTLDGQAAGFWHSPSSQWQPLPSRFHTAITRGLRTANKQQAPELLILPLPPAVMATVGVNRQ